MVEGGLVWGERWETLASSNTSQLAQFSPGFFHLSPSSCLSRKREREICIQTREIEEGNKAKNLSLASAIYYWTNGRHDCCVWSTVASVCLLPSKQNSLDIPLKKQLQYSWFSCPSRRSIFDTRRRRIGFHDWSITDSFVVGIFDAFFFYWFRA